MTADRPKSPVLPKIQRPATVVVLSTLVGGCVDDSTLDPAGPGASDVAALSWILFVTAAVVTVGVFALLAYGIVRRRRGDDSSSESGAERWVIGGGVVLPIVVLLPVVAFGVAAIAEPADRPLQIEVIGHQYWWEYRYPGADGVTANELHIPVGEPVELVVRSDDVIHSLWVPALGGKTDLVPGHETTMELEADTEGTYQGKCAEYCGLQHAKMLFIVVAQPPERFRAWLDDLRADASATGEDSKGAELFGSVGCASCHTVRGTDADGRRGPDLTHLASRRTIAAGVLPNTPEALHRWIDHTWEVKDGATMPPLPLSDDEIDEIVAYLGTLR